jgi:hypothetical protein
MKAERIVLAGILAGLAVFICGALSHTVLGLGSIAVKTLPNDEAVLSTLQQNIKEPGFYLYPGGIQAAENAPEEERETLMKQYEQKYRTQAHGVLVYSPATGEYFNFPKLMSVELASNILGALIAAWLLSFAFTALSRMGRILFVASLGLFASLAIDVSYWNWYDFPTAYLCASLLDNVIAWTFGGVVLAFVMKPKT